MLPTNLWRQAFDRRMPGFAANYVLSRPFYASFDVTKFCNLICLGCDHSELRNQGSVGKDVELETILSRLNTLNRAFGSLATFLASYEPTLRPDLPQIIKAASRHNFVGIVTNGTLIDSQKAQDYWDAGMVIAAVSIPTFDEKRFKQLTGSYYTPAKVLDSARLLVETSRGKGIVVLTATIDNHSTPKELEEIAASAKSMGAFVSFQPYSSSKPESVNSLYDTKADSRVITLETLANVFGGSVAEAVIALKAVYPVMGRDMAIKNFDRFILEGRIPFKPRSLKVRTDGSVSLAPESEAFSNLDANALTPKVVWRDYRAYVERLRERGGFITNSCYRCIDMTNPSTPIGDIVGMLMRSFRAAFQ